MRLRAAAGRRGLILVAAVLALAAEGGVMRPEQALEVLADEYDGADRELRRATSPEEKQRLQVRKSEAWLRIQEIRDSTGVDPRRTGPPIQVYSEGGVTHVSNDPRSIADYRKRMGREYDRAVDAEYERLLRELTLVELRCTGADEAMPARCDLDKALASVAEISGKLPQAIAGLGFPDWYLRAAGMPLIAARSEDLVEAVSSRSRKLLGEALAGAIQKVEDEAESAEAIEAR